MIANTCKYPLPWARHQMCGFFMVDVQPPTPSLAASQRSTRGAVAARVSPDSRNSGVLFLWPDTQGGKQSCANSQEISYHRPTAFAPMTGMWCHWWSCKCTLVLSSRSFFSVLLSVPTVGAGGSDSAYMVALSDRCGSQASCALNGQRRRMQAKDIECVHSLCCSAVLQKRQPCCKVDSSFSASCDFIITLPRACFFYCFLCGRHHLRLGCLWPGVTASRTPPCS